MIQPEFSQYKTLVDEKNPFANVYELDDGSIFYIEPIFYTPLHGFKERVNDEEYQRIIDRMIEVSKKIHHVVFV